jgi:menaquinone-9 beta-reductase
LSKSEHCHRKESEITIIGAGITGSVLAIILTRMGYKTTIIEKTSLNVNKAGESLTPECKKLLNNLGFKASFNSSQEYLGNLSRWGSDEPSETNFITNPYSNGITVDRSIFDLELLTYAKSTGVDVFLKTEIKHIHEENKEWVVNICNDSEITNLKTQLVIFAAGRSYKYRQSLAT